MDDPRDKPPGAVPQFMWPPQVTAPHQLLLPPAPPPEPKRSNGLDVAKLLGIALTIGTIIFGAGAANEKLKIIDANQKAADEQKKHRSRLEDDRYDKLKSASDSQGGKIDALSEQLQQISRARSWRRREAARPAVDDRP
jgi:hypothetical protein